ncbi:MAG: bifunctional DNA-formamidopyrimidine glycosylase/DNA-(apurinic or apyrimidinic site) lyase [Gemmatimonadota bacterium]|jgi:formamidopyrimidine-DNA glycosylase|nr:bifunctional DNA-formamidopyrimidine glycosylase/DNA-(apurinic or apyrimidinic site) lyase [Gemmatimonadota bacterium]
MPELPEVETIVRDLQKQLKRAEIRQVTVVRPDLISGSPAEFKKRIEGCTVGGVTRRAKNIVFDLGEDRLVINLGMTGRVTVLDRDAEDPPYLGVSFELTDHRRITYQDVRRFGHLEVLARDDWNQRSEKMGVEPLSDGFTGDTVFRLSRKRRVAVKPWLMDQKHIVGVGNIYASEALFRAGISPLVAAGRLTKKRADALATAVREVLREAIEFRGTTLLDYRDARGEKGEFSRRLRVYDREGQPCVVCGTPIKRIVQSGRSTFYCPHCQK